mgnify:CR=1 FL=1
MKIANSNITIAKLKSFVATHRREILAAVGAAVLATSATAAVSYSHHAARGNCLAELDGKTFLCREKGVNGRFVMMTQNPRGEWQASLTTVLRSDGEMSEGQQHFVRLD